MVVRTGGAAGRDGGYRQVYALRAAESLGDAGQTGHAAGVYLDLEAVGVDDLAFCCQLRTHGVKWYISTVMVWYTKE